MEKQNQENTETTQFIHPVPFEEFLDYRKKQNESVLVSYTIKELSKIRKLRKLLEDTQSKISNRIHLFRKISCNIQKKKEKENLLHERLETAKKNSISIIEARPKETPSNYLKSTKSSACGLRIRKTFQVEKQKTQASPKKQKNVSEQKLINAKSVKMLKQRNKIILEQRKLKQMRQKIQSANTIRNNRQRAKQIKLACEHQRFEQAQRVRQQRYKEQVREYEELQQNLTRLQREQRQALIMWKRTMEA